MTDKKKREKKWYDLHIELGGYISERKLKDFSWKTVLSIGNLKRESRYPISAYVNGKQLTGNPVIDREVIRKL